jgi:hypothetical protein
MATDSKQTASQILAQGLTLTWHVPCPPPLGKPQASLPLELLNLRDAAIVAWPLSSSQQAVKTEPLVKYIAALNVAERLHIRGVDDEMAQTLHALGHVYDTLSSQKHAPDDKLDRALACARAIRLATQYYTSPPWSHDMPELLHLQCKTLQVFSSLPVTAGMGTIASSVAKLYEDSLTTLSKVNDPLCVAHLHMGEAFWRSQKLLAAAPSPLTTEEEIAWTPTYIKQRFATRERHYQAALAVLEGAGRHLSSHSGLKETMRSFQTLLERLKRECTGISNSHGAYAVSIGDYLQDVNAPPTPLLTLSGVAENLDAILKEMDASRFDLDKVLERETDSWSATAAAQSLTSNSEKTKKPAYTLLDIISRLLGIVRMDLSAQKRLLSSSSWRLILLGALHTHRHGLESGQWGGLNRTRDIQRVKEAIQGL